MNKTGDNFAIGFIDTNMSNPPDSGLLISRSR